jgi:hypothetical protein
MKYFIILILTFFSLTASATTWNVKKLPLNYCNEFISNEDTKYIGEGSRSNSKLFVLSLSTIMEVVMKIRKNKIMMTECYFYEVDTNTLK